MNTTEPQKFKSPITRIMYYYLGAKGFFINPYKPATMEEIDDIVFGEETTVTEMTEKLNQLKESSDGTTDSEIEIFKVTQDIDLFIENSLKKQLIFEIKTRMRLPFETGVIPITTDGAWNGVWTSRIW